MSLKERIYEDMKIALRAKEARRLAAIRLLVAAIKQKEVDKRIDASDADVSRVVEKLLKQRKESITQFEAAKRMDLAEAEKFEVGVLEAYLPPRMSDAEIVQAVESAIAETGAEKPNDMGRVMTALKARLGGGADMGQVSRLVREKLKA
ncbi:MAG: GatB/YqeY domain-containing protein [Burkholderiales bacterium]